MFDLTHIKRLADIPAFQAKLRPNFTAQIFEGRETKYLELNQRSNQIANRLIEFGLKNQSRIGFIGKNSDRYFELLFGACKANIVLVGVNWRLAPPEMQYILEDAQCEILFVGKEYEELVGGIKNSCPKIKLIIGMDSSDFGGPHIDQWLKDSSSEEPHTDSMGGDDVLQLYTSGTTGHPKGVQLTNDNFAAVFRAAENAKWGLFEPESMALTCMPLFHVAGVNMGLFSLAQGLTNVITKEVNPEEILKYLEEYKINYALFVPAVILFLTQHPKISTCDFSSLRKLFYGASPIAEDLLTQAQKLFGCEFYGLYGLTETTGAGTCLQPFDHVGKKLRSCGKPYPDIKVEVRNSSGKPLPPNEVGEIVIKHGVLMKGYWNKKDATSAAIVNGWFHTGDAGYFDEEGFLYIHDRVKDMIVSGGENIYPAEVENALFAHPDIVDVAVIGIPDEKWGEAVLAFVVTPSETSITEANVVEFAKSRIAKYKVPKHVKFVETLPRNPSGKILRRELRDPYWEGKTRGVN